MTLRKLSTILLAGTAFTAAGLIQGAALAASTTGNATVDLLATLTVSEVTGLDFGVLEIPSSDSETFSVSQAGIVTTGGNSALIVDDEGAAGDFDVTGTDGDFQVTFGTDTCDAGLDLTGLAAFGTLAISGGTGSFGVTGNLVVSSTADADNSDSCTYPVTVVYDS